MENNASKNSFSLPVIEPWEIPVDGAHLLDELEMAFNRFVILPENVAPALALWTLHTYGYEHFEHSPRLAITSPEKQCGKSTLLSLLEVLVCRPLPAANITPAAIFRTVELVSPTLLVDEADTFLRSSEELRGVLNAGHRCNGKVTRIEVIGKQQCPKQFKCFCPCAIAAISKRAIPDTILDRSLIITMRRKTAEESVERFRIREAEQLFANLKRKCVRFMLDNGETAGKSVPEIPEALFNRTADNWEALIAIADLISPQWSEKARHIAVMLSKTDSNDDTEASTKILLLADLKAIFNDIEQDFIPSQKLCETLALNEERDWGEFGFKREPITTRHLSKLLKEFGIRPKDKRIGEKVTKAYLLKDCIDAFSRYLPDTSDTATTAENSDGQEL